KVELTRLRHGERPVLDEHLAGERMTSQQVVHLCARIDPLRPDILRHAAPPCCSFLSVSPLAPIRHRLRDRAAVEVGRQMLRYKPAQGSYGCYGHFRGALTDHEVRRPLRRELLRRGAYMFLAYLDGRPAFIGSFRTLLPADSEDARKSRNHGTGPTIWAEIVCNVLPSSAQ